MSQSEISTLIYRSNIKLKQIYQIRTLSNRLYGDYVSYPNNKKMYFSWYPNVMIEIIANKECHIYNLNSKLHIRNDKLIFYSYRYYTI